MVNVNKMFSTTLAQRPQILTPAEFAATDSQLFYRGCPSLAKEFAGTHEPQVETYGPGLYFASTQYEAETYVRSYSGELLTAKLASDANVWVDSTCDIIKFWDFEEFRTFFGANDQERPRIARKLLDNGVDAYFTARGEHLAVLNRSKLLLNSAEMPQEASKSTLEELS